MHNLYLQQKVRKLLHGIHNLNKENKKDILKNI